jgi:hypothetical protein
MSADIFRHKRPRGWDAVLTFPALVTFKDKAGKIHNPPMPPCVKGRYPWTPEPGKNPRKRALKHCPNLGCRRAGKCIDKIHGQFCRKTHLTREESNEFLLKRINKLNREADKERERNGLPPFKPLTEEELQEPVDREMRDLFNQRIEAGHLKDLLKWQKAWVQKMQVAEKLPPKSKH